MIGTVRWLWRQLTSMRTALMLLLLLAVAALPGSILLQRPQAPADSVVWSSGAAAPPHTSSGLRPGGAGTRSVRWAGLMSALPSSENLERLTFRLNAVAFVGWTFTVIAGAIWAEQAWGRYWGWDSKETWSFVIWVVYAGYLQARATRGWQGRRAAVFALVGYACIAFNVVVVNLFFLSRHAYSGVG